MNKILISYSKWVGVVITALMILICGIPAFGVEKPDMAPDKDKNRPDLLIIDSMKLFGDLEKREVLFMHDKHTDELEKQNKDCKACHLSKDDKLSPKFMRIEDSNKQSVMDIYHLNCIQCHQEMIDSGEKTGPIVCAECHQEKTDIISTRQPMGMDKSLHYRHSKAYEKKCETCHHEYNEETKKLFYAKEKEGTCRYCHKEKTEENRISMELASHASCIDCHMKKAAEKKEAGPVKCAGCHDLEKQKLVKKVDPVPRMERKQPDFVLIKTGDKELDAPDKARMDFVPFNHKAHEETYDTCRVCHHGELSSCSKCHSIEGKKEGGNIPLEQAMHKAGTEKSCEGCHAAEQEDKNCSGCHVFLDKNSMKKKEESTCLKCHIKPFTVTSGMEDAALAEKLLASKTIVTGTYEKEDIPEKVVIKLLSDKYEPAEFPHRDMVNKIVEHIKENKLAGYFHDEKGTLCQGCHHNSPATKKPTGCTSCHSREYGEEDIFKPGIKGAYHIQCMGCHSKMGVEKTGCTDCHKEKVK